MFFCYREKRQDHPPPQVELEKDPHWQEAEEGRHLGLISRVQGPVRRSDSQLAASVGQSDVWLTVTATDSRTPVKKQESDEQPPLTVTEHESTIKGSGNEEEMKIENYCFLIII